LNYYYLFNRLFWSQDERFLNQFKEGKMKKFIPYSKYPPCYKDISFWLPDTTLFPKVNYQNEFHANDVYEVFDNDDDDDDDNNKNGDCC